MRRILCNIRVHGARNDTHDYSSLFDGLFQIGYTQSAEAKINLPANVCGTWAHRVIWSQNTVILCTLPRDGVHITTQIATNR